MRRWLRQGGIVPVGALVVIVLDQLTKHWVRQTIPLNSSWQPIPWLDPIFTFTHIRNTGAAFGLFGGMNTVFIVLAFVVVAAILVIHRQLAEQSALLRLALTLQLGGATGNLIDRVTAGYVTDFVNFRWWPIWNIADACILIGTILLAIYALFMEPSQSAKEIQRDEGDLSVTAAEIENGPDTVPPRA
mgnify:CR=1 FL=1